MPMRRRDFLAGVVGLGAGLSLGAFSHWFPLPPDNVGPDWFPGKEQFIPSTCTLCPSHCGIRGRLMDGKLVRIEGNPLHPVSRGGICPKGVAGIQLLYHPGRLTGPVERVGPPGTDQFRKISWEDALTRIANTLAEIKTEGDTQSVGWLMGNQDGILGELCQRFTRAYGTPHLLQETYDDGSAEVLSLCQGISSSPAFDLADSDLVLSFGAGLSEAWWCQAQTARARDAEEGSRPRWVQVDVRHSRTAARADEWIPIRPGTYGALALGIAYILLKEGLYDSERLRAEVQGIEDWKDDSGQIVPGFRTLALRYGRTDDISKRTGIPSSTLVRLAKAFGNARRPLALWDQMVSWRAGGLPDALAIHTLNILVGGLNRPGGILTQPRLPAPLIEGASQQRGPLDEGATSSLPAAARGGPSSADHLPPNLKMLFLYYSNPVASAPDGTQIAKALGNIPLVVSFSPFLDESAKHAHLVLPDHTYLERWQDAPAPPSVPISVWGIVQPMISPLYDTRATGDVILDLAARLGGDVAAQFPWKSVEEIVEERGKSLSRASGGSAMVPALRREEMRELESRGWWLPHGKSESEFWESIRESGGWFDPYYDYHDRTAISRLPGGKVQVFSLEARRRVSSTVPGLVAGFLPVTEKQAENGSKKDYPLRLVPYRVMTLASGSTALMPWLLEHLGILTGDAWETWAEVNPSTGRDLGLSSGQLVRIESTEGHFQARLRFFRGAQPGVVNVPYGLHTAVEGWGQARGANPVLAIGARRDPTTGLPDWNSTQVRIQPAHGGETHA